MGDWVPHRALALGLITSLLGCGAPPASDAGVSAEDAAARLTDAALGDGGAATSDAAASDASRDADGAIGDGGAPPRADSGPALVEWSTAPGRAIPAELHGVTSEGVASLSALTAALERHSRRPTTRIVFQAGTEPSDYTRVVEQVRTRSYVMGELLDSTGIGELSVRAYEERARAFVSAFGDQVDIWEIGNELNGEWAGRPSDLRAKVLAAYEVIRGEFPELSLRTAVTLNYWPSSDCYAEPWEATLSFAAALPEELRAGVDYLLLSFYETACDPRARPSVAEISSTFEALAEIFPSARIGFGEVGAQGLDDGFPAPSFAEKEAIARRYYGMHAELREALGPRYVGGYFWWYYDQDAVPWDRSGSLWPVLDELFSTY